MPTFTNNTEDGYRRINGLAASMIKPGTADFWNNRVAAASDGHDIRNYLAVIMSAARLLSEAPDAKIRGQLCEAIEHAATSLQQLTERSIDSVTAPTPEVLDIAAYIRQRLGEYRTVMAPGQTLIGQFGNAVCRVRLDVSALDRALLNLVLNARDSMNAEGCLRIRARCRGTRLWLTVADNGAGMPTDVRARIGLSTVTTKPSGTGLGLPQVLRFAQMSGGQMYLRSKAGSGTVVSIVLSLDKRG